MYLMLNFLTCLDDRNSQATDCYYFFSPPSPNFGRNYMFLTSRVIFFQVGNPGDSPIAGVAAGSCSIFSLHAEAWGGGFSSASLAARGPVPASFWRCARGEISSPAGICTSAPRAGWLHAIFLGVFLVVALWESAEIGARSNGKKPRAVRVGVAT